MNNKNISNKILDWYDKYKRDLPWRKPNSKKQSQYFTLVSEIMLQQTQVQTVIPYFKRFISEIPDINSLSKVKDGKLLKLWEGLGYYSRAKNLKITAQIIRNKKKKSLPDTLKELKELPGIGDYTAKAIMALEFNKKVIPLDGNIERLLKRQLLLKKENEINKDSLNSKLVYFGTSHRQRDYVQALMELGSLVCKPIKPSCSICPISNNCNSLKHKDFEIVKKNKINKTKYFEAKIYINNNKMLLIKNKKFGFLKNLFIFPMNEINKLKYKSSPKKKTKIKISNIEMNILISQFNKTPNLRGKLINSKKFNSEIIPSFTKKLFRVALG